MLPCHHLHLHTTRNPNHHVHPPQQPSPITIREHTRSEQQPRRWRRRRHHHSRICTRIKFSIHERPASLRISSLHASATIVFASTPELVTDLLKRSHHRHPLTCTMAIAAIIRNNTYNSTSVLEQIHEPACVPSSFCNSSSAASHGNHSPQVCSIKHQSRPPLHLHHQLCNSALSHHRAVNEKQQQTPSSTFSVLRSRSTTAAILDLASMENA